MLGYMARLQAADCVDLEFAPHRILRAPRLLNMLSISRTMCASEAPAAISVHSACKPTFLPKRCTPAECALRTLQRLVAARLVEMGKLQRRLH